MDTAASTPTEIVAEQLKNYTTREGITGDVRISNELIKLLSDQLYQSPLKAIEELVVNAYDAYAKECRIFVPPPAQQADTTHPPAIVIADDGDGMDEKELISLLAYPANLKISIHQLRQRSMLPGVDTKTGPHSISPTPASGKPASKLRGRYPGKPPSVGACESRTAWMC